MADRPGRGRRGRRAPGAALALALAVAVAAPGCKWIPARRADIDRDRPADPVARNDAPSDPAALPPLPPMRSIDDDEAFRPSEPTPLLDAAAERDADLQRALAVALRPEPPAPIPPPPPSRPEPPASTPEPADRIEEAPADAPAPAPAPAVAEPSRPEPIKSDPMVEPAAFRPPNPRPEPPAPRESSDPAPAPAEEAAPVERPSEVTLWQYVMTALAEGPQAGPEPTPTPTPAPEPEAAPVAAPPEFAVADLRLCRRVLGFGRTEPMAGESVAPSQAVLIYCELEGLRDEEVEGGFRSRLGAVVSIEPAAGGPAVWRQDLGIAEDHCARRRRDFFVNYRIAIPNDLPPGEYRLRLEQTDLLADRKAERQVPLTVRGRGD